jgi:hypothetical protein
VKAHVIPHLPRGYIDKTYSKSWLPKLSRNTPRVICLVPSRSDANAIKQFRFRPTTNRRQYAMHERSDVNTLTVEVADERNAYTIGVSCAATIGSSAELVRER